MSVFIISISVFYSFQGSGFVTFTIAIIAFGLIPILEIFFSPDPSNISEYEEEIKKGSSI